MFIIFGALRAVFHTPEVWRCSVEGFTTDCYRLLYRNQHRKVTNKVQPMLLFTNREP